MKILKKLSILIAIIAAGLSVAAIFIVNYQIIGSWIGKNGPSNLGSIEVSYITMAKFIVESGSKTWIPVWYFGFPFHLFYTPLLPYFEAFLHQAYSMPYWEAYRFVTGFGYILAPISLFFLGWQLSKRVIGGAIAGMLFTVGGSLFYWINDGVAGDRISQFFWDPRRYTILVRWGEGPHTFSMMFIPLVGLFFLRFLEKQKLGWLVLASVSLGLAGLSNAIGLMSSIIFMAVVLFVKHAQKPLQRTQVITGFLITGLLALGLISFWYDISFIRNFFAEGGGTGKMLMDIFPWGWVGGIMGICLIYFLFSKVIKNFALAVSLLWFSIFFLVVFVYYSTGSMELLPQALRYNVESDMAFSLLVGVSFAAMIDLVSRKVKVLALAGNALGFLIVVWMILYIQPFVQVAAKSGGNTVDITKTGEYDIAAWLKNNVDETKGEREFLPGNYGFYLDWFTNVWQHRGALFQASINPWPDIMHYQMATGKNADLARAWLVIANTKYAVITGPGTREMYREIEAPERFTDYQPVYSDKGDTIYQVPLKRPSTAKPVSLSVMQTLKTPKKGDDKEALLAYADWVENSSTNTTGFTMLDNDNYKITGTVGSGEGLLVQMAYHNGWHARDNTTGQGISVKADPMNFIVLYPKSGNVDITLFHTKTWDEYFGYAVSAASVVFLLWYAIIGRKRFPLLPAEKQKKEEKKIDDYE